MSEAKVANDSCSTCGHSKKVAKARWENLKEYEDLLAKIHELAVDISNWEEAPLITIENLTRKYAMIKAEEGNA